MLKPVDVLDGQAMPELEDLAKERYEKAYGSARPYARYSDTGVTTHGGLSPRHQPGVKAGYMFKPTASHLETFRHRGEHDVESSLITSSRWYTRM